MWINGKLAWESSKECKPYNATEEGKVVDLQAGVNEILFRCENNGGLMGWSVIFMPEPVEG